VLGALDVSPDWTRLVGRTYVAAADSVVCRSGDQKAASWQRALRDNRGSISRRAVLLRIPAECSLLRWRCHLVLLVLCNFSGSRRQCATYCAAQSRDDDRDADGWTDAFGYAMGAVARVALVLESQDRGRRARLRLAAAVVRGDPRLSEPVRLGLRRKDADAVHRNRGLARSYFVSRHCCACATLLQRLLVETKRQTT